MMKNFYMFFVLLISCVHSSDKSLFEEFCKRKVSQSGVLVCFPDKDFGACKKIIITDFVRATLFAKGVEIEFLKDYWIKLMCYQKGCKERGKKVSLFDAITISHKLSERAFKDRINEYFSSNRYK